MIRRYQGTKFLNLRGIGELVKNPPKFTQIVIYGHHLRHHLRYAFGQGLFARRGYWKEL